MVNGGLTVTEEESPEVVVTGALVAMSGNSSLNAAVLHNATSSHESIIIPMRVCGRIL